MKKKIPAIAFDATGVIYRGIQPLPGAKQAFQKLIDRKIPYCVLTNAGGSLEKERASRFNQYLGLEDCFNEGNVVQANTPMKDMMLKKKSGLAIVTGREQIHENVEYYLKDNNTNNFKYLTIPEMQVLFPILSPLTHLAGQFTEPRDKVKDRVARRFNLDQQTEDDFMKILVENRIDQIFVMSQVFNYEANLQIITDLLGYGGYHAPLSEFQGDFTYLEDKPRLTSQPEDIELLVSADDMLIPAGSNSGQSPRQTLGAFIFALNRLMKSQYYGKEAPDLKYEVTGKPSIHAFDYAKNVLQDISQTQDELDFYMVGDSPMIDMHGGKNANMKTILVESGMYNPNDPKFSKIHHEKYMSSVDHIVKNVEAAVDLVIAESDL